MATMTTTAHYLTILLCVFSNNVSSFTTPRVAHKSWHLPSPTTTTTTTLSMSETSSTPSPSHPKTRRDLLTTATTLSTLLTLTSLAPPSSARLEAVNRPDLLPSTPDQNVIQIEKFLTPGQAKRMDQMLANLEKDTGYRLRVLCQSYPNTPGLAIRDYWDLGKEGAKDDKFVVLVVDEFGGKGNVLNFNVGDGMKFALPNVFWTRLQGKYGTKFFVKENGIDLAIINAVEAITTCLRSPEQFCVNVPDEGVNMKSLGF